ncbi:MAG TPA: ESX secretion-associated protein EspG [Actinoplanes sp.]|nr:ESX secretion-associated protein EspG [Actinoplanes sp.]
MTAGDTGAGSGVGLAVSGLELDVLWEHLGLGPFPTVFRMLGHGRTRDERRRLVEQAWASLGARGLGTPEHPDPLLSGLLTVLAGPECEVDARMGHRGREVRALAGVLEERAALGVLDRGGFRFSEITPGGLARAVVGLLPDHPAGTGHSVTLSTASFRASCEASGDTVKGLRTALLERGMREGDADQLAAALDGPFGGGQFGAAARDRWGHRHRAPYVVGFVDTASGRYLLESKPTLGGAEEWTTVAPTDPARLAARTDHLLATPLATL